MTESSIRKAWALPPDGTIGVVSPASPIDTDLLDYGIALLEAKGFQVRVSPHARDRYGHLAGRDEDRAADFMAFYADPKIDILWCSRGGSSSCRLWPYLDWDRLAALPPKLLVGYSDITSLQIPLSQRANTPVVYGHMVGRLTDLDADVLDWELSLLMTWTKNERPVPARAADTVIGGVAEGRLCGGCLSLVSATIGTPYQIDSSDAILFLEDIDSTPWQIERDLIHLREAGLLDSVRGFVIGEASRCNDTDTLPIRQIWTDLLEPYAKPMVLGFPTGHVLPNYALPFNVRARLMADNGELVLLESPVG